MLQSAPRQVQRSTQRFVRRCVTLACAVFPLAIAATPAHTQIVRGRVIDAMTGRGLDDVSISVVDDRGQSLAGTITDPLGRFRIEVAGAARTGLRVERPGYRGFIAADAVPTSRGEEVVLEVRLATDRIVIGPISVVGRRRIGAPHDWASRIRFMRTAGIGQSLVRAEIAEREVVQVSDLLATIPDIVLSGPPRARSVLFANGVDDAMCPPRIFLNGRTLTAPLDGIGPPLLIDALELYNGPVEEPAEFQDPSGCGVLLIWTRPDPADATPTRWRRAIVYLGMAAVGVVLFSR